MKLEINQEELNLIDIALLGLFWGTHNEQTKSRVTELRARLFRIEKNARKRFEIAPEEAKS